MIPMRSSFLFKPPRTLHFLRPALLKAEQMTDVILAHLVDVFPEDLAWLIGEYVTLPSKTAALKNAARVLTPYYLEEGGVMTVLQELIEAQEAGFWEGKVDIAVVNEACDLLAGVFTRTKRLTNDMLRFRMQAPRTDHSRAFYRLPTDWRYNTGWQKRMSFVSGAEFIMRVKEHEGAVRVDFAPPTVPYFQEDDIPKGETPLQRTRGQEKKRQNQAAPTPESVALVAKKGGKRELDSRSGKRKR